MEWWQKKNKKEKRRQQMHKKIKDKNKVKEIDQMLKEWSKK